MAPHSAPRQIAATARIAPRLPKIRKTLLPPSSPHRPHREAIHRRKQARPDSGYSFPVYGAAGQLLGEAPLGNRKDIRNAVEAARAASGWARTTAHARAQVIYYIAENMIQRRDEIAHRLAAAVGEEQAAVEADLSIERIFTYAAWADKYDGQVHHPPGRNITIAMPEPVGAIGILAPSEAPLLGLLSLVLPAISVGNTVVAVPSERYPLIQGDLYQVLDTSDLPGGVVNLVAGVPAELGKTLAEHDGIEAIWCFRSNQEADRGARRLHRQYEAGIRQRWPPVRLVQSRAGRRPLVPAARHASEKHLGSLRRMIPAIATGPASKSAGRSTP